MNELNKIFTELFHQYSTIFKLEIYSSSTRKELMNLVSKDTRGVYTYWVKGSNRPIYIGCAGKVSSNGKLSGNTIKKRIFSASTPYHFCKKTNQLYYGPTTTGVPPEGYNYKLPLDNLDMKLIIVTCPTAPAALEHLLLQGYINQFGALPDANQKI